MSMGDLFDSYDGPVVDNRGRATTHTLDSLRSAFFEIVQNTPHLDWLLLTKRIENVADMVPWGDKWPSNVWLGYSASTQADIGNGYDDLLSLPARIRFLSIEPMLEPISLPRERELFLRQDLHWVIFGCESGPKRRPCFDDWIRSGIRHGMTIRTFHTAIFVKQIEVNGRVSADPSEWPKDLRVQEFPENGKESDDT
jgi:protein gp37